MATRGILKSLCSRPSVVITSSCDIDPTSIVKELLGGLPTAAHPQEDCLAFQWRINNKYYEADVNLIALKRKCLLPVNLSETVQAVMLVFDSYAEASLDTIDSWNSFLQPYRAYIRILICTKIDENDSRCLPRLEAQKWCILNGFELVELHPSVNEWEEEQDFRESTGMLRVKQALHAHTWPNLLYKEMTPPKTMEELWHGGTFPCASLDSELKPIPEASVAEGAGNVNIVSLDGFVLKDFVLMKDQASKLPRQERHDFAEQMVAALWFSIPDDDSS
uniref:Alpha-and gamma-adaptin-binding protein p34 n=1 Tax=Lygus hesperus TaxID=30085 RepID=A0A0A9W7S9_LYGHE